MAPFGYVGGKTKLATMIVGRVPDEMGSYYEPFLGSGAVLIEVLKHRTIRGRVVASDINPKLVSVHRAIKDDPEGLIRDFEALAADQSQEAYYRIRDEFNGKPDPARFFYLNTFTYNRLYRENGNGKFNAPWGHGQRSTFKPDYIRSVSKLYNDHDVQFKACTWKTALKGVRAGDVVYLDPPYVESFTGFTKHGFDDFDTEDLVDWMSATDAAVIYSNHDTDRVRCAGGSDLA